MMMGKLLISMLEVMELLFVFILEFEFEWPNGFWCCFFFVRKVKIMDFNAMMVGIVYMGLVN
jgi:hypothetical protein